MVEQFTCLGKFHHSKHHLFLLPIEIRPSLGYSLNSYKLNDMFMVEVENSLMVFSVKRLLSKGLFACKLSKFDSDLLPAN